MHIVIADYQIISVVIGLIFAFGVGSCHSRCRALSARLDDYRLSLAKLEGLLISSEETIQSIQQTLKRP